ncbi:MAG TPA: DUF5518 domain-containing protein [Methanobacterium sp.]|nr:DUF5518 domain-containing protein [Methanobacterium sp.]
MTDWSAVGIGGVVTAALTIVFALVFFPLFFLGPIIGGFVTVYLMKDEFESGIINGGLAGVIGGLIIGILSLLGIGVIAAVITVLAAQIGIAVGALGALVVIFFTIFAVLICGVLSAIGGAIGEYVQSAGGREYENY